MTMMRLIILLIYSLLLSSCKESSIVHKQANTIEIKTFDNVEGLKCRFVDLNGFSSSVFINDITFGKSLSKMNFTVLDRESFVTSEQLTLKDTEIQEVTFNTSSFPTGSSIDSKGIPQLVTGRIDLSSEIVVRYWHETRGRAQFIKKRIIQNSDDQTGESQTTVSTTIGELEGCAVARLSEQEHRVIVE